MDVTRPWRHFYSIPRLQQADLKDRSKSPNLAWKYSNLDNFLKKSGKFHSSASNSHNIATLIILIQKFSSNFYSSACNCSPILDIAYTTWCCLTKTEWSCQHLQGTWVRLRPRSSKLRSRFYCVNNKLEPKHLEQILNIPICSAQLCSVKGITDRINVYGPGMLGSQPSPLLLKPL